MYVLTSLCIEPPSLFFCLLLIQVTPKSVTAWIGVRFAYHRSKIDPHVSVDYHLPSNTVKWKPSFSIWELRQRRVWNADCPLMRLKTSKATLCGGNAAAPSSHATAPHLLRETKGRNRNVSWGSFYQRRLSGFALAAPPIGGTPLPFVPSVRERQRSF